MSISSIKIVNGWIRTRALWHSKQPLCQLCHNHLFQLLITWALFYKKNGPIPASFFLFFVFSIQLTVNVQYKILPMTGFEPRISGIESDRSINWATTTVPIIGNRYSSTSGATSRVSKWDKAPRPRYLGFALKYDWPTTFWFYWWTVGLPNFVGPMDHHVFQFATRGQCIKGK